MGTTVEYRILYDFAIAKSFTLRLAMECIEGYPDISVNVNGSSHQLCLRFMAIVWQQQTIWSLLWKSCTDNLSIFFATHSTEIET